MAKQQSNFNLMVDVHEILMNKARLAGSFETKEGETVDYKDAVQIKMVAIRQRHDKDLGQDVDYEDDLLIEIPCPSMAVVKSVLQFVNGLKHDGTSFTVPVVLKTTDKVLAVHHGADFVNYVQAQLK
jgi:hypothetical protein